MNPLAGNMNGMNDLIQFAGNVKQMMAGRNPAVVMQMMAQKNPQFGQFLRENQGKSAQQIAQENGLDWGLVQKLIG